MVNFTIMLITMSNLFTSNKTTLPADDSPRLADLQFNLDQLNVAIDVCHRDLRKMGQDRLELHNPDEEALEEKCQKLAGKAKRVRIKMEGLALQ
jgi:hypothetical protein